MIIKRTTFDALLKNISCAPPEMGGILGGTDGVISTYQIDFGTLSGKNYDHYYPNSDLLNRTIKKWEKDTIEFYGMFHSHFPGGTELSLQDKRYISQIMLAMPKKIDRLFFPIILSNRIISYQAFRCGVNIRIVRDAIKKL